MTGRLHASGFGSYDGECVVCKRVRLWRKMRLTSEIILVLRASPYSPNTGNFAGEFLMDVFFWGGGVFSIHVPCVLRDYLHEGCAYIVIVTDDKTGRCTFDEPDIVLVEVQQLLGSNNGFRNMLVDCDKYLASIAPAASGETRPLH